MIFCTDTHFIHESSSKFILNQIYYTKSLVLPTITSQSIRTKIHKNNYHFISAASTEQTSDNGVSQS